MKTIAIANQKGGTGKTTTAYNLGIALTQQGYRVLMVDFDPQGNLSCYCGIPPEQDLEQTITELLMKVAYEKPLSHRECVYQSKRTDDSAPQVDFIPSNLRLASFELAMGTMMCREVLLKTCLEQYSSQYDYCIIDCSPSVGLLLTNALSAANEVIIPMQAQPFSVVGMSQLTNSISSVQRKINPGLHIRGVLLTMTQHTKVSEHYAHDVRAKYGRTLHVFTTEIPYNVKVQESQAFAAPTINVEGLLQSSIQEQRPKARLDMHSIEAALSDDASFPDGKIEPGFLDRYTNRIVKSNNRYIWMLQLMNVQQIMPIQSERQPIAMVTYKSGVPYDIEQEQIGKQDKESAGPDCATICRPQDFFLNMSRTKRKRKLVEWLESCQENQVRVLDEKIPLLSFAVDFVTAYEYQKARGIKIHPGLWKDMRVDIFLVKKEN